MRVLITGAAGDFGRDLAPWLARRHDVIGTDVRPLEGPYEFRAADLSDPAAVDGLCEGVEAVIHLAALLPKAEYAPPTYLAANTLAPSLLAEEAIRAGVQRFIYVSTVWATGHGPEEGCFLLDEAAATNPLCKYGVTKLMGEIMAEYYARNHALSTIILRATGYLRHPAFDLDGEVDWEQADLVSIAERMTTPSAKLYNPADLGPMFQAALARENVTCERFLMGQTLPFKADEAELCRQDPIAAWDKHFPGAREFFAASGHQPPSFTHAYDNTRAREELGFQMQYDLGEVISAWRLQEGGR